MTTSKMLDVVTFGSASRDLFIVSKDFKIVEREGFKTKKGLCVPAESKIYIDDIVFGSGGGGTNCAATFALQGFRVAYVGKVGKDEAGQAIIKELQELNVTTDFISETDKFLTMQSFILSAPGSARTILVYQGACNELIKNEVTFDKLKTKWFYISSLSGHCAKIFEPLLNFAHSNKIKIAVNPGKNQLELGEKIVPFLNKIDIFILNQEEASFLTGLDYQKEKEIFKKLDDWVQGIVVMTKGPEGVIVSDGKNLYKAGIPKSGLVDRTGAGDAFGAGFVSGIIQRSSGAKLRDYREAPRQLADRFATPETIEYAVQLGTANATSCLQQIGAKNGLLRKGEWGEWERVEVRVEET